MPKTTEPVSPDLQNVSLKKIKILSSVQPRDGIDQERAAAFAELLMEDPAFQFAPGTGFQNPRTQEIVLAGGFTRHAAYTIAERTLIPINVFIGDEGDAGWFALFDNSTHGKPLSREELTAAIDKALEHRNRGEMTQAELAKKLGVSERTVGRRVSERKTVERKTREEKEQAEPGEKGEKKAKFSPEVIEAIDAIGECNEAAKAAILNGSIKKPDDELIAFAELDCPTQLSLAPYFFTSDLNLKSAMNAIAKRPTSIERPLQDYVLYTMMKGVDQSFYFNSDTVEVHVALLAQTPETEIVKPAKPQSQKAKVAAALGVPAPEEDEELI